MIRNSERQVHHLVMQPWISVLLLRSICSFNLLPLGNDQRSVGLQDFMISVPFQDLTEWERKHYQRPRWSLAEIGYNALHTFFIEAQQMDTEEDDEQQKENSSLIME